MDTKLTTKQKIRKMYLIYRFKHNYGKKPLVITPKDRRLGLTQFLIHECIDNNCKLVVSSRFVYESLTGLYNNKIDNIFIYLDKPKRLDNIHRFIIDTSFSVEKYKEYVESHGNKPLNGFIVK